MPMQHSADGVLLRSTPAQAQPFLLWKNAAKDMLQAAAM